MVPFILEFVGKRRLWRIKRFEEKKKYHGCVICEEWKILIDISYLRAIHDYSDASI